jgi:phospho-N-acetylmuramoyl-pentapeptide-transferase
MNPNSLYLFATSISLVIHFILFVPFINFLYRKKMQRNSVPARDPFGSKTPIFDKYHGHKTGTPIGGGILVIVLTSVLFVIAMAFFGAFTSVRLTVNYPSLIAEVMALLFTFLSFGLLGLYDDLSKIFLWRKINFLGLRLRQKLLLEIILAGIIASWLYFTLKINIIHIPFVGTFHLGYWYIIFATFVIVAFANAVNITDGLDGLSSGVLMISLGCFWIISRSIIDVPTSTFIAVWLGGLMAFLYFNVYPARLWLGDTGALSFGATFAVIALILGKAFTLPLVGGVFLVNVVMSGLQLLHKRIYKRKLFPVAPFHLFLQYKGWEEPKVVFRLWLVGLFFACLGLAVAFLK